MNRNTPKNVKDFIKEQTEKGLNPMGIRYFKDGEKLAFKKKGKEILLELPEVELIEIPKLKEREVAAIITIHNFILDLMALPRRQIPALVSEVEDRGVKKSTLESLQEKGFIMVRLIGIENALKNNKKVGAMAVVYFTVFGKAYIKKKFGGEYVSSKVDQRGQTN